MFRFYLSLDDSIATKKTKRILMDYYMCFFQDEILEDIQRKLTQYTKGEQGLVWLVPMCRQPENTQQMLCSVLANAQADI